MPTRARARVTLHRLGNDDRADFLAAMQASRGLHRGWVSPPLDDAAFDAQLARLQDGRIEPLLVRLRAGGALVGAFNLSEIVRGPFQNAYLGYCGVQAHTGLGYMGEGMALLLRHAFTNMGLHRIEANIQPANARSLALVERAGFTREGYSERYLKVAGRWRDHERWAIRSEQWVRSRRRLS